MAQDQARKAGFDDALMLNSKQRVACGTVANVFMVEGQRLITPPLEEGVLPGVTRAAVLRLANKLSLAAVEERIAEDKLMLADEVFLTNSLMGLRPVGAIDHMELPTGTDAGTVTAKLMAAYEETLPR